jgi:transglutaminase-like putative cysteine protease
VTAGPDGESRRANAAAMPPRPLSSYALAGVAGAALAVTGALAPAAVVAQLAALLASARLRHRPRGWQRSAWVLNGVLAAIVLGCTALWLRGGLAILALAHFAHLATGLQLLDARPRRSDFLLVALALFQVLLAANLTDSLLFPPLLLVFALAMTWTLVVHTLWSEAIAAGEPWEAERAAAPGLARTTLVAAALSLVLAIAIFLVLPRVRSGALAAPGLIASPQAGFSDRIALGDLGRIRQDPTVVLRVETLRGTPPPREDAYWRGLAFDHFDGRHWSVTPPRRLLLSRATDLGMRLPAGPPGARVVQRLLREPVAAGVLFSPGAPVRIEGSFGRLEADPNGGLYAPESEHDRAAYALEAEVGQPERAALREDHAVPPPGPEGGRYLALPELSEEITALALRIVAGADTDADRIAALERHLRETGRYADRPPPERPGDPRSPIEAFLLEDTAGHCEYFASGMVVLARSLGFPARLVNGFAGGAENPLGGFVEVTRSDAHAWVEVHFERAGWVRYDPTPTDARLRAGALGVLAQLRGIGSALEHWWYQHVVEFDRSHQMRALRDGWLAWQQWRNERRTAAAAGAARPAAERRRLDTGPLVPLGIGAAAAGALSFAWWRWRRPRLRGARLPAFYGEALRLLERHRGLVRAPAVPAREFARSASRQVPPAAAAAFWTLTEDYLATRFGGRRPAAPRAALRTLRDTLRRR